MAQDPFWHFHPSHYGQPYSGIEGYELKERMNVPRLWILGGVGGGARLKQIFQ